MERRDVDVCVVGAGFAGLTAALRLQEAGREVALLEARDRVGGRSYTESLDDGTRIDRGGAWFGPGQDHSYGLAREMGVDTYRTWSQGDNVLLENGRTVRYKGTIPMKVGFLQLANLGVAVTRLDAMAKKVPADRPWNAARAREWDATTLGAWLAANTTGGSGRRMLTTTLTDVFTADPAEVSLLSALHLISSNGGFQDLVGIEGAHQQDRVVGGTQAIADRVAERLGDALHLDVPVRDIAHGDDGVRVAGRDLEVHARRVVVAVPPWLTSRIWWEPRLPTAREQLLQRMPTGEIVKISVVYDEPWWREEGLTGQSLDPQSVVPVTIDGCGPDTPPGILVVIGGGPEIGRLTGLDAEQRRSLVIDELVKRFGPQAAQVRDYVEQNWAAEPWTAGGMMTHFPSGVLTTHGPALRAPCGRVHWASTETAERFFGCIDGAISSGERAAREVLSAELEPAGAAR